MTRSRPNCALINLSVATWNATGLAGKEFDVREGVEKLKLDFIFICETWARPNSHAQCDEILHWSPVDTWEHRGHAPYGVALWASKDIDRTLLKVIGGAPGLTIWWSYGRILFGGIYLPPKTSMTTEQCRELLNIPTGGETFDQVVLLGDFNMRLGTLSGDKITTRRGKILASYLMGEGYTLMTSAIDRPTCQLMRRDGGNSMVDQIWSNLGGASHAETGILEEEDLGGSDHRLVYTRILVQSDGNPQDRGTTTAMRERMRQFNLGKLKERAHQLNYQSEIRQRLPEGMNELNKLTSLLRNTDQPQEIIDKMSETVEGILKAAAEVALGSRLAYQRKNTPLIRNVEFREARRRRRRAYKKLKKDPQNQQLVQEYATARKEQGNALIKAREEIFDDFADRFEKMQDSERSKTMASMIRSHTRGKNTYLDCDSQSLDSYATYFEGQYARRDFHQREVAEEEAKYRIHGTPFGALDIRKEMNHLVKGKTPGDGGLRNELLIHSDLEYTGMVEMLFAACWQSACIPSAWKVALLHPIPKKGDLKQIQNYRPISLTESMRKLFERVLLKGLCTYIEPLDICQGGFRSNRGTLEQIAALHESIQQRKVTLKRTPIVAYLDIKAAYDTVDRRILWNQLVRKNIPREWLNILKEMFDHNESQIAISGFKSRRFKNEAGLMQGSVLSPLLYAAFIDELPKRLRDHSNFTLGDLKAATFLYADDIAIVADDSQQLRGMLGVCEAFSKELGFQFSPTKCEIVASEWENVAECRLYGERLKHSDSFVYLGVTFDQEGINKLAHVTRLVGTTTNCINMIRAVGFHGHGFSIAVRRRMYETFVRPKLEYGLQLMEPKGEVLKTVERTQYQALCAMFSVSRKTTSAAALHGLASIQSMTQRMRELNAMWQTRVEQRGDGFMISEARKAYHRKKTTTSVFKTAEANPMVREYQDRTRGKPMDDVPRKVLVKEIRDEHRRRDRRQLWATKGPQLEGIDEQKYKSARWIDYCSTRRCRRLVTLWLLRKIPGPIQPCRNCNGLNRATRKHIVECTRTDPTARWTSGQTVRMLQELSVITGKCLGKSTTKLDRDIIREHSTWEERNARRMESYGLQDRGAHAYWRYFLQGE